MAKAAVFAHRFTFGSALLLAILSSVASGQSTEESGPALPGEVALQKETVVLLHGMGRSRASLWVLDMRLRRAGYHTVSFPYVTHSDTVDELSERLLEFIEAQVTTDRYHLVAHSLGNIIIRNAFRQEYPEGLGRIVMLAPPNKPAELARALRDNPIYKWFTGGSGRKLSSEPFYEDLPVPPVEFGVIAGDRGQFLTFDEPNDGVITVESTKLAGSKDWILVHHSHTFIMNGRDTAYQCLSFLKTGKFDHSYKSKAKADTDQDTDKDTDTR